MFGRNRRKREAKKLKEERKELEKQRKAMEFKLPEIDPVKEAAERAAMKEEAKQQASEMKQERHKAREEGWNYGMDVTSRNVPGLSPTQRQNLSSQARRGIDRDVQGYERKLLASQGKSGLRGPVAEAQRQSLARMGSEAQRQAESDISQMDIDTALKKLAAIFSISQGEAAQTGLDLEQATGNRALDEERKRQRALQQQYNMIFGKI